jgi:hypothetical protein
MTKQRAVNRGFDSRQGREMSPLQSVQTGSGVHPPSHIQSEPGALSDGVKRLGTKITIHLHLMLSLIMPAWRRQGRNLQNQNLNKKSFQHHRAAFEAKELRSF